MGKRLTLVLIAGLLGGCVDDISARGSAIIVIKSVIERSILLREGSKWLYTEATVGPCRDGLQPKYCSPVLEYTARSFAGDRQGSFRITSSQSCPLLKGQLLDYQKHPHKLRELVDVQPLDTEYLNSVPGADIQSSESHNRYANAMLQQDGRHAELARYFLSFIKSVDVDCTTGTISMELHRLAPS